jgi:hypothetical protein
MCKQKMASYDNLTRTRKVDIMKQRMMAALLCSAIGHANAAFVWATPFGNVGVSVHLTGEIKAGDLEKMQVQFKAERDKLSSFKADPSQIFVNLNSPGGDLHEAMAIGRWVRKIGMTTLVVPNDRCYSSCVYILAAGLHKHVAGQVGIHRPYLTAVPAGGIDATMKVALRTSQDYFAAMNLPSQLADTMFSIPPDKLVVLDQTSLARYRLDQTDLSYQEALDLKNAAFYGLTRQEYMVRNDRYQKLRERMCDKIQDVAKYECWNEAKEKAGLHKTRVRVAE